jgi:hypothetical protein
MSSKAKSSNKVKPTAEKRVRITEPAKATEKSEGSNEGKQQRKRTAGSGAPNSKSLRKVIDQQTSIKVRYWVERKKKN